MIGFLKRRWVLLALLAQLAVPACMVWNYYQVVNRGTKIRLEVKPVDPLDFFCGRYVALSVPALAADCEIDCGLKKNDIAYVYFETPQGEPYARVAGIGKTWKPDSMRVRLGDPPRFETHLNRFYLDERFAPEVETMVRRSANTNLPPASIEVALKGGAAIVTQLYIGDKTAEEACREARKE